MAGHSKWANIKHRKAAQDAKRGKLFGRLINEITVAARMAGGNPADNPRLRLAMDKALAANMPKDTVQRAVERGSGTAEGMVLEEILFEGYAPGGVAIMVETVTDNRNRTVAEVRHVFSKYGGNLGTDGSVSYLFDHLGVLEIVDDRDEETILEQALELGAEDVEAMESGGWILQCPWTELAEFTQRVSEAGLQVRDAELVWRPQTLVQIASGDSEEKLRKLLDALDDLTDTQAVHSNSGFAEEESEDGAATP